MKKKRIAGENGLNSPAHIRRDPPLVGIIMGSSSDWETLKESAETLELLGVPHEKRVVSAHRTPDLLFEYASQAEKRGLRVIIAGAGGAAHLPGMTAAKCVLPVLGVPVESKTLHGIDSLLSIVQMPAGVPVATFAIGKSGAVNAALFAAGILGISNPQIMEALERYRREQTMRVLEIGDPAVSETSEKNAVPRASKYSRRRPKGRQQGSKSKRRP